LLRDLATQLNDLSSDMLKLEAALVDRSLPLHKGHRRSACNLAHYLALRRHDIRALQAKLAVLGLSSLGRTEGHVLSAIQTVHRVLNSLIGSPDHSGILAEPAIKMGEGSRLLKANTDALLGPRPSARNVRIMVTMPTEASTDYELVRDLVRSGMDCMRINCAHDNPDVWLGMIRNLEKARKESRHLCRVEMDLAGPKLRTGPIEPGRAVIRCRPERDELGRVTRPALIWLTPVESPEPSPQKATAIQVPQSFLAKLRRNDTLHFRDARDSERSLWILKAHGQSRLAELEQTAYLVPGTEFHAVHTKDTSNSKATTWSARIGPIPPSAATLLLKPGESLLLTRSLQPGIPARRDKEGRATSIAQIGVTLPEFFKHAKAGQPIWFDDGKIGGVIRSVNSRNVRVEITHARPSGERLGEAKGINLPDTRIDMPALTPEDIGHLKFIVQHADIVAYSFVRTEDDVHQLLAHLRELKGESLGIVLKIETR
jgi:pyruvate kinase